MANGDYGYFGKGDTGYAQYMTAFNRNFGGSSGDGGNHTHGGGGVLGIGTDCLRIQFMGNEERTAEQSEITKKRAERWGAQHSARFLFVNQFACAGTTTFTGRT